MRWRDPVVAPAGRSALTSGQPGIAATGNRHAVLKLPLRLVKGIRFVILGLALAWASPLGPLRLSYAMPINEREGIDRVQRLQFKFGTSF